MVRIIIFDYSENGHGYAIVNKNSYKFYIAKDMIEYFLSFSRENDIIFKDLGYKNAFDFCEEHNIHLTIHRGIWPYCQSLNDLCNLVNQLNIIFSKYDTVNDINIF